MIIENENNFVHLDSNFRKKIMGKETNEKEVIRTLKEYGRLYLKNYEGDRLDKVAARVFSELYRIYFEKAKKENYNISKLPETLEELTK